MITFPLKREEVDYYYNRAYDFVYDQIIFPSKSVIHGIEITPDQKDLLNEVTKSNRISVESGHGTGKSSVYSWIGIWFMATRINSLGQPVKIPCIAPTYHQLHDILWPEFTRWIPISRFRDVFEIQHDEIFMPGYKEQAFIRARSPRKPDNVQGFHAPHLLWLCDEAFGIIEGVWEVIEGSLTQPDNKIILAGQHTVIVGYVHGSFRDAAWKNLRFDSSKSPIAKPEYAIRMATKYGKNSDVYRVRVLGQPPKGNPEAFIQMADAHEAVKRVVPERGRVSIGLDVARYGNDSTVATMIVGDFVYPQKVIETGNTIEIAKEVVQMVRAYRKQSNDKSIISIKIDATGGYGAGVIDQLQTNNTDSIDVHGINFTGKITDSEYYDGVSRLWGELRDRMKKLQLPDDEVLIEEISTRKFEITQDSRVKIQNKEEFKKDYGSSPDRADSLVLAVANIGVPERVISKPTISCVNEFDVNFTKIGEYSTLVCSQWHEDNGHSSIVLALWNAQKVQLYVFISVEYTNSTPDFVIKCISKELKFVSKDVLTNLNTFQWYGSPSMFTKDKNDLCYAYGRYGQNIQENQNYDEPGAILLLERLLQRNAVYIHDRCEPLIRQLQQWTIDKGKPGTEYGLCRALIYSVSCLWETGRIEPPHKTKSYSKERTEFNRVFGDLLKREDHEIYSDEQIAAMAEVSGRDKPLDTGDRMAMW